MSWSEWNGEVEGEYSRKLSDESVVITCKIL